MLSTSIKYMDYYIPQTSISVEEAIANSKDTSSENTEKFYKQFKEQSKIDKIAVFSHEDEIEKIITDMVEKLFKVTGINPAQISYLVGGNRFIMDGDTSIIHYIHKKFQLANAVILPLFQPCVSSLLAMGLSSKLLGSEKKEYMLILSINKETDIKERFIGFTVMGDGISLLLVENKPGAINIKNWRALNDGTSSFNKLDKSGEVRNVLEMRSNIIKTGVSFIEKSLDEFGVDMHNIDVIITPNTYHDAWNRVYSGLLEIDPDKFYLDSFGFGGHINDVDYVRNIKDYLGKFSSNKKVVNMLVYGMDIIDSFDVNYHILTIEINKTEMTA